MVGAARVSDGRGEGGRPGRAPRSVGPGSGRPEPALRAPWPAVALAAVIVLAYAAQRASGDPTGIEAAFGLRPDDLTHGDAGALVTSLFVHASWTHALINALAALAFGAPVARRFGGRAIDAVVFALFFVLCGVVGSLGFVAAHIASHGVLVGASGGIAGLMGATSRLSPRSDRLASLTSRSVLTMAGAWIAGNLALGLIGLDVGAGGAPLAWEAHIVGYLAGALLIGAATRLVRPTQVRFRR